MTMEAEMGDVCIPAGEFKSRCLHLLDRVAETGESLTITKRGKAVARLVALPAAGGLFGAMSGSVRRQGDLVAPISEPWESDT
jgi:prevent-host-death family protein